MAERSIDLAVAAEPYRVPDSANWLGDTAGSVAIVARVATGVPPLAKVGAGRGYVAAQWGELLVVGVYCSPNTGLAALERLLGEAGDLLTRRGPTPTLLMGDPNAKSTAWGCPRTDVRGEALREWASGAGLLLLNRGARHTCVRRNGGSVVDVSFADANLARGVTDWEVLEGVETGSDHRYVRFRIPHSVVDPAVAAADSGGSHRRDVRPPATPRWVARRLDKGALAEAATVQQWLPAPEGGLQTREDVEGEAEWFRGALANICDHAMPRASGRPPARKSVYWWSDELAALRGECVAARRRYTRARRRGEDADGPYAGYREAVDALRAAVRTAKDRAWDELLGTLDEDPWGCPYLMVRKKLRSGGPALTENLDPRFLEGVVAALFPAEDGGADRLRARAPARAADAEAAEEVSWGELAAIAERLRLKRTAPGPDGVPIRALMLSLPCLQERYRGLVDACFRTGLFPARWRTAAMILLRKVGRSADSPSAYRPICLLDEAGKLMERVMAGRIVRHLSTVGPDLADEQFGFRANRSTVDAIARLRRLTEGATSRGRVALAVSLDIANAFNSLPWGCIREALRYHGIPEYLRRTVESYLSDRGVTYRGRRGQGARKMERGVPQGSVLGPLLWNLGYNRALRGRHLPAGVALVCYADDTLVVARGESWSSAVDRAEAGVTLVVERIERMGLRVALEKTEALWFPGSRRAPPSEWRSLEIRGVRVEMGRTMRYLGLHLDGRWGFRRHLGTLAPKVQEAAVSLGRLLPNLGGPGAKVRRLYEAVVRSMTLYGAPIWHASVAEDEESRRILRRVQRRIVGRIIRGYRTVGFEATCALAGSPPWELVAGAHRAVHDWRAEHRSRGAEPPPDAVRDRKLRARGLVLEQWEERLRRAETGVRVAGAIGPVLREWLTRRHGTLTFRLVQVLSGHGCFGEYLHRVTGRESTSGCHHCGGASEDTAQHTLEACPAWRDERRVLTEAIGADLSLPAVVRGMAEHRENWDAVASFCESVMSRKEAAEREREDDASAPPNRKRRGGGRGGRYARLP